MILKEVSSVFDENSCSDEMCLSSVGQFFNSLGFTGFRITAENGKSKKESWRFNIGQIIGFILISDKLSVHTSLNIF